MGQDVESITPRAQDYLKAIWSATEWSADPITTKQLAHRFGSSSANVTDTVKRLAEQGLVDYAPYKPVRLTRQGSEYAVVMVRRHRLIETYLCTHLGYSWDEVHEEAERLEHAATDRFIERVDAALGHPTSDPHGDPIPGPHGQTNRPVDVALLGDLARPGPVTVYRVSDAEPAVLRRAAGLGLVPGAALAVKSVSPLAVSLGESAARSETPSGTQPVPADVATAVWVRARGAGGRSAVVETA